MEIFSSLKELLKGKDLYRLLLNKECANYLLDGHVLDIGSGLNLASYHRFFKKSANCQIVPLDLGFQKSADQSGTFIDLESDRLPAKDNSADIILVFNLLEHLYNYSFLVSEIKRVLKPGGQVIGCAPFLVGYHPDPRDYWRYTSESLTKIFEGAGFTNIQIKILGRGPFSAAFSQIEFLWPRVVKLLILPMALGLDKFLLVLRPRLNREKFALGLFFRLSK